MTLHHKNEIYNLPQGCSLLKVKNIPWLVRHTETYSTFLAMVKCQKDCL